MSVERVASTSRRRLEPEPQPARTDSGERRGGLDIATTHASRGLAARHLPSPSVRAAAGGPTPREIQGRLDAFKNAMEGPYRIGAETVRVPAGFRMNGGFGPPSGRTLGLLERSLSKEVFRALARDIGAVSIGKGSPEQVRRVVQALIDSPVWKSFAPPPRDARTSAADHERELAVSVRHLMWEFGIGADCSGYVHHAFLASRGASGAAAQARYGLGDPAASGLQAPPPSTYRKVSAVDARPGDFVVLNGEHGGSGHKVIVYSHTIAPDGAARRAVSEELGSTPDARIHLFEVDSSWGAGFDAEAGGVKRLTWALDEASGRWATVDSPTSKPVATASDSSGPYDHELGGIYRPRSEP